jgi:hypothetical protein
MLKDDIVTPIQSVFSKNRAEEIGYDVWEHFVVPPFYHRLDVQNATKPRLIIGGRGCGKTMLLRYWSHQSMFSPQRKGISDNKVYQVGLYWRADTQFASAMVERNVSTDTWEAAFAHMSALVIGSEMLNSLHSIIQSHSEVLSEDEVQAVDLKRLRAFKPELPGRVDEMRDALQEELWRFEAWVNDVRKRQEPYFLPGRKFVLALLKEIQRQLPVLSNAVFFVYIDEYENLATYQQTIINTWLKHSEPPLVFNLAMKRNAFETLKTTGTESLSDIHDFRTHDLEQLFLGEDAAVFFAEILFLKLANAGVRCLPTSGVDLRDPARLSERSRPEYKREILRAIERILPDVTRQQLALNVFQDESLSKKLRERIKTAAEQRGAGKSVERFYRPDLPEASIITPALLHRKRNSPDAIAAEMELLERGEVNYFTGRRDWIQNNFVGSLLQLYEPYDRACPFYAGFHTFLKLSRGNIRHFLELCHKSIERAFPDGGYGGEEISPAHQAEAARQASTAFLGEIRSFGRYGNKLHFFVLGLGSLFALAHLRPSLSESEQSHFSIVRGEEELTDKDQEFLREATKWSVIFEEKGTKLKQNYQPETVEYVLNPIYAPYFHISYRKMRKLELKSDDVIRLMRGSYEQVSALLKRYRKGWAVEPSSLSPTLFSHLEEEQ